MDKPLRLTRLKDKLRCFTLNKNLFLKQKTKIGLTLIKETITNSECNYD